MAEDEDFELDDLTDAAGQEGNPSTTDIGVEAQAAEAAPGNNDGVTHRHSVMKSQGLEFPVPT